MRPHLKKLVTFSILVHLGGLVVPLAHGALVEAIDEACSQCDALRIAGPRLEARCGGRGPCEKPGHHHHHRRHDHGPCALCQQVPSTGLFSAPPSAQVLAPGASGLSEPASAPGFDPLREQGEHFARGPPRVS